LGHAEVGGLIGSNFGYIATSYATGNIIGTGSTGTSYVLGGLVGSNYYDGSIEDCYATGDVSGVYFVGGLIGENRGSITNCYVIGSISGTSSNVGGLIGYESVTGTVVNCFWNTETCLPVTSSPAGTGKTTTEMKQQSTFTDAGWDFVGETFNGIENIWFIPQEDYPHLWWEFTNSPPVANAGDDQIVYICNEDVAEIELDGSRSTDADGDELTYWWTWEIEGAVFDANGVNPIIELPVGLHTINLSVDDGVEESEPNSCVIEVIEGIEVDLRVMPRVINRKSRMARILAVVQLPAGIGEGDIDGSFWLYPGEIEPRFRRLMTVNDSQKLFMVFDKSELMAAVPGNGAVVLEIEAQLISGRCLYGSDRIRIIRRRQGPTEQTGLRKGTRSRRNRVKRYR